MQWRGHHIHVHVQPNAVEIAQTEGEAFSLNVHGTTGEVPAGGQITVPASMTV